MHCVKALSDDVFWVGTNDRRLSLFENLYPIPRGVSYNAYVVMDEKTVLIDTVDEATSGLFFQNLKHVLGDRDLDYAIINHMEPDHGAGIDDLLRRYPNVTIVSNAKAIDMMRQFFDVDLEGRVHIVKEGDELVTGAHRFQFVMAPMVHWPECMVTYDAADGSLYSGDAFGTFGAINGQLYADQGNFERDSLPDARRYYTNIVGKYGPQVQALLKKASGLDIRQIRPLHGPVWRENLEWFIEKYDAWSSYRPEDQAVLIVYGSMYGHTEQAAQILAFELVEAGVHDVSLYDVSSTDVSHLVAEAFRCSHLVMASVTHNAGLYPPMLRFLSDLQAHNLQNRTVALIENGTWALSAGRVMTRMLEDMKNMEVLDAPVSLRSSVKPDKRAEIEELASRIAATMQGTG